MKEKIMQLIRENKIYAVIIGVLLAALLGICISALIPRQGEPAASSQLPAAVTEPQVKPTATPKVTIDVSVVEEGLNDMGFLVTQEYWFTDAVSYSSVKTLFNIELGFTESAYLATYDGKVSAGMDFTAVTVEKDDTARTVTVTLPAAEIYDVSIDLDSMQVYEEKNGFTNPLKVTDVNNSLSTLKQQARERAQEKGVLEQAEQNGLKLAQSFIDSLALDESYTVTCVVAGE